MLLPRSLKGTANIGLTGARSSVILDNRMRNQMFTITLRGTITVAGGAAGAVKNGGSLLAPFNLAVNENGEDTYGPARAWLLQALSEDDAASPEGFTRLPASANLPIGVYPLFEKFNVVFGMRQQLNDGETYFIERTPNNFFQVDGWLNPNATVSLVGTNGGSTQTLTGVTMTVEQWAADAASGPLPVYKPRYREIQLPIVGIATQNPFYIRSESKISHLVIGAEATDAQGGTIIVADVITAARLLGDQAGQTLIGPNQIPFVDLVEGQRYDAGGDVTFLGAKFVFNAMRRGRLADLINAQAYGNFRWELANQLSAGALPSNVICGIREMTTPAPRGPWAVVQAAAPAFE